MAEKREFSPIKATSPNPKKIMCKDCVNRDRTTIKVNDKELPVGITKDFCDAYKDGKPYEVLFLNEECRYYIKDYFKTV